MLLLLFESQHLRKVLTMFMFNVTEGMYFFWIKISLACLVFANILSDTSLFVFIFMLSLASSFVDTLLSVWTRLVRHSLLFNTLRLRQNGCHFPDDIFKCIFLNENVWISIKISLKFVPKGPINNILALVQIMAWHRPGDKPLSENYLMAKFIDTYMCHSTSMGWHVVTWQQIDM